MNANENASEFAMYNLQVNCCCCVGFFYVFATMVVLIFFALLCFEQEINVCAVESEPAGSTSCDFIL